MSTILKALRRLEEDKRAQAARSLDQAVLEPARPPRSAGMQRGVVVGVLLSLGIVAVVWASGSALLSGSGAPDEDAKEAVEIAQAAPEPAPPVVRDPARPAQPPVAPAVRPPTARERIAAAAVAGSLSRGAQAPAWAGRR